MGVDSGASENVVGPDMLKRVETVEGDEKRRGVRYEAASGELIPNMGEKKLIVVSENNVMRGLSTQVTEVNQPLLSVRKMMKNGNRVVFDDEGSYILDKKTGEWMPLQDNGSMFMLKLWAKAEGF